MIRNVLDNLFLIINYLNFSGVCFKELNMSSHLGLLPVFMVLLASGTFIISYIIAVVRDDVSAAFPYIR